MAVTLWRGGIWGFLLALFWIDACVNMPSDWDKCSDSECRRESQLSAYDQPSSIAETLLIKTLCQSIQLYQSITLCLKDSRVFFYTTDCSKWLTFMCKGGHENVVAVSCGCIIVEQWKHRSFKCLCSLIPVLSRLYKELKIWCIFTLLNFHNFLFRPVCFLILLVKNLRAISAYMLSTILQALFLK